jgi:heptosyltransferase-3
VKSGLVPSKEHWLEPSSESETVTQAKAMNLLFLKYFDRTMGRVLELVFRLVGSLRRVVRSTPGAFDIHKILLIKIWGIGNIVMMLPIVTGISQKYPKARLSFLTLAVNRELLDDRPELEKVYTVRVSSLWRFLADSFALFMKLRREKFDIVLDFEQFSRFTSVLTFLMGAKHTVGFFSERGRRGYLYDQRVAFDNEQHMSRTFFDIARSIGVVPEAREPKALKTSQKGEDEIAQFLKDKAVANEFLVGMHIGSSDNFPGRRWPNENFAQLADTLVDTYSATIIFTGGAKERALIDQTIELMHAPAINSGGRLSISGFIAMIARCDLFFSNDTAPVHIASALDVPIVAFYGPNTPKLYGPIGKQSLVFYKELPCSPCITNFNAKTSFCRFPVCIESITVEEVLEGVRNRFGQILLHR